MPGIPFLYFGDEIGMRYMNLSTKEGGYFRAGSRTPMQWNNGKNMGFSKGNPSLLYLPVDSSPDAPNVEQEDNDSDSLLSTVKQLLSLRKANEDLQSDCPLEIIYAKDGILPFVYRRGHHIMAVNPSSHDMVLNLALGNAKLVWSVRLGSANQNNIEIGAQSFLLISQE